MTECKNYMMVTGWLERSQYIIQTFLISDINHFQDARGNFNYNITKGLYLYWSLKCGLFLVLTGIVETRSVAKPPAYGEEGRSRSQAVVLWASLASAPLPYMCLDNCNCMFILFVIVYHRTIKVRSKHDFKHRLCLVVWLFFFSTFHVCSLIVFNILHVMSLEILVKGVFYGKFVFFCEGFGLHYH